MNGGLGDDVGVQAVAEVDRVDVVTGAKLACARIWAHLAKLELCEAVSSRDAWRAGRHSPFQIAVHNGEEDLQEQVDGVYQHRQKVQPCFASHCEGFVCCGAQGSEG